MTLRLPPDASAQISAETDAGAVRSQGLSLTEQHFTPRSAGGQYSAQLEPGEATVELRTKNGTILIAAADSLPADTAMTPQDASAPAMPDRPAPPVPTSDTTVAPEAPEDTAATVSSSPNATASDTTAP